MRVGHNPARFVEKVAQPSAITVAVVNCIPFLSGYYAYGLDVLAAVIESLHSTRESKNPFDVMVFDNNSCREVKEYLKKSNAEGKIQYLILSDTNIGKIGAWNFMFGAAPGEFVVFSDGDILFRLGWLSASMDIFETYPNVGMVTARPLRTPMEYSTATLDWANQQKIVEEDHFLDWETFWEHVRSLGRGELESRKDYESGKEFRVMLHGKPAFIGAAHFQFMARRDVLQRIIPLPSNQPMRGERKLDIAINNMGLLRLTTAKPFVSHMGNIPPGEEKLPKSAPPRKSFFNYLFNLPIIRHSLLWLNNRIFRLYFYNVE